MEVELKALRENQTWYIVELPPSKKGIGSKWVYKEKFNSDGSLDKYKTRLVVNGYNQVEGIDYIYTFSLVTRMTTLRTLLAIVANQKWTSTKWICKMPFCMESLMRKFT